ncbi:MAG: serine/threonine-protein phosphatase [Alphaproteobacteria bacterium]|nr:serine/threonine-protein phosphatase [Alphaproteobacteria bacterium]
MTNLLRGLCRLARPRRFARLPAVSEQELNAEVSADGRFGASAITHPGSRSYNEDSYISCPELGVWAVADGVGGHEGGEIASRSIVEALRNVPPGLTLAEMIPEVRLRLRDVHLNLQAEAARRGRDVVMASTVVVLLASGNHFACLWAGDSRAYLLRNGLIRQVTQDHSLVQEMLNARAISEDEAITHPRSNVITRAVGAGAPELELDEVSDRLDTGDRFLLCSDGLWKMMGSTELAGILAVSGNAVPAERLLATALQRKADDNVTVITVQVGPG